MTDVPAAARLVIIGGGIIGCSTAYHLAQLGWRNIVLLERAKLTSGSTFHAAGLVGQLRTNANITRLLTESVALYEGLEGETGQATGWKQNGGLRLACNRERMTELRRQATTARSFGLEMHILSPSEARDLWPLMNIDDLEGAAFLPTDGQANPSDITQALAKGARQGGATIIEDCAVTGIAVKKGRVAGVLTEQGELAAEIVVNCAGQWAREVGAMASVNVPLVSVQHQYLITEAIDGVTPELPTLRDPDRLIYFKEEVGGLSMGGYEPNPRPWAQDGIPPGFNFSLLDADMEHFEPLMSQALARVPALAEAGVKDMINGPASPRMATSSSARRPSCAASMSAPASTPSASLPLAAPARCWPSGLPAASRPWTSGRSTFAASADRISRSTGSASGRWNSTASTTRSPGRTKSTRPGGPTASRRSTPPSRPRAPALARSSDGSGPTGSPATARGPATCTPTAVRTGSTRSARSTAPCASAGRPDRPILLRQVHDGGTRCRRGARLDLRQ